MRALLPALLLVLLAGSALAGETANASSEKTVRWTTAPDAERLHALKARLDATAQGAVAEAPAAGTPAAGTPAAETPERLASGGERQRVPVEAFHVLWLRPAASDPSQATALRAVCRAASEAAPGAVTVPPAVEK